MVKSIVGKVVLGLMFVMSSTILFSQNEGEKYPDISGFWKIRGGNVLSIYQVGSLVYQSNQFQNNNITHRGVFIDKNTVKFKGEVNSNVTCYQKFSGTLTIKNNKEMYWEWIFPENGCYIGKNVGNQTIDFLRKFQ